MKNGRISKLLIIGGYGTFGGRLAEALANETGLTLLIAGRSLHKAQRFAAEVSGTAAMLPATFDRNGDVAAQIAALDPDLVVDASGPYQAYGDRPFRVAEAAIAIGAHYLDLADSTEFVCNISSLDVAARNNGVFVLAGTSTCPALTAAVARSLSHDLVDIESIAGGIAPSPFAGMGKSVVQGIAGYAGKPLMRIRAGKLQQSHSFVSTRKFTIAPPGEIPLAPKTFSLIDVPDLRLLNELDQPAANTWFGVSTSPPIYHALLRLLARGVKVGILPTLRYLSGAMYFVMNNLSWGEHRGGMFIETRGTDMQGRKACRSWHLIADGDCGPTVPTLAATAIIRQCIDGRYPEPGARPAISELEMSDFLPLMDALGIRTGQRNAVHDDSQAIFKQVLGDAFNRLPTPIRELHADPGESRYSGRASIRRGRGPLASVVGWLVGFPDANEDIPVSVRMTTRDSKEIWRRDFAGHVFSSEMSVGRGRLAGLMCERFGPGKFAMALVVDGKVLRYVSRRWTFFGIPMPKWMMPNGAMYETVSDGKFAFHVEITLPLIGHVVTYKGDLKKTI